MEQPSIPWHHSIAQQPQMPTSRFAVQLGRIVSWALNSLSVGLLTVSQETLTHVHKMTYTEVCNVKN